jgi:hypothetical protein
MERVETVSFERPSDHLALQIHNLRGLLKQKYTHVRYLLLVAPPMHRTV